MAVIVARTYMGGKDLFHGIPNLQGATVVEAESIEDTDDYNTTLTLQTPDGQRHLLIIVQEREA